MRYKILYINNSSIVYNEFQFLCLEVTFSTYDFNGPELLKFDICLSDFKVFEISNSILKQSFFAFFHSVASLHKY